MIVLFSVVFFLSFDWLNIEIICCYAWARWSSWSQCNPKGRTISKRTDPWTWEHWLTEGCHCLLRQGHSARTRPGKMMHERQRNGNNPVQGTLGNLVHYCLCQYPSVLGNFHYLWTLVFWLIKIETCIRSQRYLPMPNFYDLIYLPNNWDYCKVHLY